MPHIAVVFLSLQKLSLSCVMAEPMSDTGSSTTRMMKGVTCACVRCVRVFSQLHTNLITYTGRAGPGRKHSEATGSPASHHEAARHPLPVAEPQRLPVDLLGALVCVFEIEHVNTFAAANMHACSHSASKLRSWWLKQSVEWRSADVVSWRSRAWPRPLLTGAGWTLNSCFLRGCRLLLAAMAAAFCVLW